MADSNRTVLTLDQDEVGDIRRMLLVGLAAFGEIQRLENAQELARQSGDSFPEGMAVINPSGLSTTISEFATALQLLEVEYCAHESVA